MATIRNLAATSTGSYTARRDVFENRPHLVVPVTMLVDGVVHAINADTPELVTAQEFGRQPIGWSGRPVYHGHPMRNGSPVSGNLPEVLAQERVGTVFAPKLKDGKLVSEAWIDEAFAKERAPELLKRIEASEPIEISVGAFVETDDVTGEYGGKRYEAAWRDIVPDHLALLPAGDEGACSREMGCGVRAASARGEVSMEHMYAAWLEDDAPMGLLRELRNIPQSERDQMDKSDFAGPNESFPIKEAVDVSNAARAIGRAKGDRGAIKSKIISIAYRKGADFVSALPDDWKRKSDQKNASTFVKIMDAARNFFRVSQTTDEMSDGDLRSKLMSKIQEVEPNVLSIQVYYPINDPAHVVYQTWEPSGEYGPETGMGYQSCLYERSFELSAEGIVTLGDAKVEVVPVTSYEPAEGASAESDLKTASSARAAVQDPAAGTPAADSTTKPCGCGGSDNTAEEQKNMTKAERIAALKACEHNPVKDEKILESLTEEQLTVLESEGKIRTALGVKSELRACASKADAEAVIKGMADAHTALHGYASNMATKAAKETPKEDAPKDAKAAEPTFDELLAKANPDIRAAIKAGEVAAKQKRADSIKALKASGRNQFSDTDLEGFNQEQLDRLVSLAGVNTVRDFGGAGAPRANASTTEAPAIPNMAEALRAARAKK